MDFITELRRSIRKYGPLTLLFGVVLAVLFWTVDQWAGDWLVGVLNPQASEFWKWMKANPVGATIVFGVGFVAFCATVATRNEVVRKFAMYSRGLDEPQLEILWKEGETYQMYYGKDNAVLHYRICVVNRSEVHKISNVQVKLEALEPYELNCVPCLLRQMNDLPSDGVPYKESFDLKPNSAQFVDLLIQDPNETTFWILHTVRRISELVKKQAYRLTISATADHARPDVKRFELYKHGPYWQMKQTS
jgi:hypothetical protein